MGAMGLKIDDVQPPVQPDPLIAKIEKDDTGIGDLGLRGLKDLLNIVPESAKDIIGSGGIPGMALRYKAAGYMQKLMRDKKVPNVPSRRQLMGVIKERTKEATGIPQFDIKPPESVGEYIVDIASGIGKFATKLAVLKRAFPTAPGAALWEMENLASGGTPGLGAATYGVFKVPSKLIKGITVGTKAGKIGLESLGISGVAALESKIDTGEIDWKQVAISAALPLALRTPSAIKKLIKVRHPKTLKAVVKVSEQSTIKRLKPEELKHYKVLKEGIKDDKVLNFLATKYPKLLELPDKIKFSSAQKSAGWFIAATNTVYINPRYASNPAKAAKILIHEIIHAHSLYRGKFYPQWKAVEKQYGLKGKSNKQIEDFLNKLSSKEYKKLPTEEMSYRLEELIGRKIRTLDKLKEIPLKPQVVTHASVTEKVGKWVSKGMILNKTERKVAVKKLRALQAARGREAYDLARAEKKGRLESLAIAKKAFSKKANIPEMTPLELSPQEWEVYGKRIESVYKPEQIFQRSGSAEALKKMSEGRIPTDYEFGLLAPVLGKKATIEIYKKFRKIRDFTRWDIPRLIRDGLHSTFGYDPQAIRSLSGMAVRHPKLYGNAVAVNIKGYVSSKAADKAAFKVETSKEYQIGKTDYRTNYLGMTPWASSKAGTRLQQYGEFADYLKTAKGKKGFLFRKWGDWLLASERGANVGINTGINSLVKQSEGQLAGIRARKIMSDAEVKAWRSKRGTRINALTKRLTARNPDARGIQEAARWVLFSPSHTISRPAQRVLTIKDVLSKNNIADRTFLLQMYASNIAAITAISGIVAYTGHKMRMADPTKEPAIDSSPNPFSPLWGRVRVGNDVIDISMGESSTDKLMLRLIASAYLYGKERVLGQDQTRIAGNRAMPAGEAIKNYLTSRESMIIGLANSLATGKDWIGKDISKAELARKSVPFEFINSLGDAMLADGLLDEIAQGDIQNASKNMISNIPIPLLGIAGFGTQAYPVRATTTRKKFRNILAKKSYKKGWDELSSGQQLILTNSHKPQFDLLNEQIRVQRLGDPASIEQIKKAEVKAGKDVRKMLSRSNRTILKEVSLGLSRRPKGFALNDKRFHLYKQLVAQAITDQLDKMTSIGVRATTDIQSNKRLQVVVKNAKTIAYGRLRREIREEE
jgi:hypothetical protein